MDLSRFEVRFLRRDGDEVVVSSLDCVRGADLTNVDPVRLPPSHRGQRHYPGVFWSATTGHSLVYESLLELERLWLADFAPDVAGIATQPMHLTGPDGPVVRRHVPDVFLTHVDGACTVVDVKAAKRLARPEVQEQFAWTAGLCQAKGWRYEVFTGAPNLLMRNIRMVAAGRRAFACAPSCLEAVTVLVTEPTTWELVENDAAERGLSQADVRLALFRLLWTGVLTTDLSRPLSGRTLLERTVVA